jgi:hypothetical protein
MTKNEQKVYDEAMEFSSYAYDVMNIFGAEPTLENIGKMNMLCGKSIGLADAGISFSTSKQSEDLFLNLLSDALALQLKGEELYSKVKYCKIG